MEMTMVDKSKAVEKVEDLTPAQQIEKHKSQIAEIAATIKEEALRKANEAIAELKTIDLNYVFCEEVDQPKATTKGIPSDAPCVLCGFKTIPPHDKRSHKTHPGPFNEEDLKVRKMVRA
jgi:hypothetical protein